MLKVDESISLKYSVNSQQFPLTEYMEFIVKETGKILEEITLNQVKEYLLIILNHVEHLLLPGSVVNNCAVILKITQVGEDKLVSYIVSTKTCKVERLFELTTRLKL